MFHPVCCYHSIGTYVTFYIHIIIALNTLVIYREENDCVVSYHMYM